MFHHFPHSPRRGFTLIELLVSISIITLLVAIVLPALSSARRAGQAIACANHLKQMGLMTAIYTDLYKGVLPRANAGSTNHWMERLREASNIPNYLLYRCPGDEQPAEYAGLPSIIPTSPHRFSNSYGANRFTFHHLPTFHHVDEHFQRPSDTFAILDSNTGENAASFVIFRSAGNRWISDNTRTFRHDDGVNVLHMDMHVKRVLTDTIPDSGSAVPPWRFPGMHP